MLLDSVLHRLQSLERLGRGALEQLEGDDFTWRSGPHSNSVAVIVQHLRGNMLSRWTEFLASDGEKEWRDRDGEFTEPAAAGRDDLLTADS